MVFYNIIVNVIFVYFQNWEVM